MSGRALLERSARRRAGRTCRHVPGQPLGPVDLDHANGLGGEEAGQGCAEGPGAFDTDRDDRAVGLHPREQVPVAVVVGRELAVSQQAAVVVDDHSVVGVLVGVDTRR